jgi:predicted ATPase/class 3 adenylate cyclase
MSTDQIVLPPMAAPIEAPEETDGVLARAFLFTDIEGSTKLWEQHPIAMRRALAQHDALLFAIAEQWEGHVFKTIGDAFCIAFTTPEIAVRAAVEAQHALFAQEWGQVGQVRVRMAIHYGEAEARDNDYFGTPLNRSARLRDVGHGGQILVSATVWQAFQQPETILDKAFASGDISFLDQGRHKLKDLSESEHVYQVLAPGLPTDFPKLRTPSTHPNNLPAGTTSFVGRRSEARAVRNLLTQAGVRLVTLSGMGGTGKTRLALEIASDLLEMHPEGVWFLDLAPLATPTLVLPTLLRICGLKPDPSQTPLEQLSQHFREARALLVLDTFEQVADAADDIAALLRATNHLRILVTSRSLLELSMEYEYAVPPLRAADCAALFEARAQQALPDFALDDATRPAVEAICARVDNLPLSIELAAAQMRSLPLNEILEALEQSMDVLATRMRDLSPRQRSLRGAIDWSYGLLTEEARCLFRSLSVFVGGFSLTAAEKVCGTARGISPVAPVLERLRSSSLVREAAESTSSDDVSGDSPAASEEPLRPKRYTLLESLRQYGQELLQEENDEAQLLSEAHREYFLEYAKEQDALLRGAGQKQAKDALETEVANLRAAMDRASTNSETVFGLAQFGVTLRNFWKQQGYLQEGLQYLSKAVTYKDVIQDQALTADLLFAAGNLAYENALTEEALRWFGESAEVSRSGNNPAHEARALTGLGALAFIRGDLTTADTCYTKALQLRRDLGDRRGETVLLNNLALLEMFRGEYARARQLSEESIQNVLSLGDEATAAAWWNGQGAICEALGDYAAARDAFQRCYALGERLGIPRARALALINLSKLTLNENENEAAEAMRLCAEALEIVQPIGDHRIIAPALLGLGRAQLVLGDLSAALQQCHQSLIFYHQAEEKPGIAAAFEALAEIALAKNKEKKARLFLETAKLLRAETGARHTPQEAVRMEKIDQRTAAQAEAIAPGFDAALAAADRLVSTP